MAPLFNVIQALTLVVTRKDCKQIGEDDMPSLLDLRGTFRDAGMVDRVMFIDDDGTETYIKNRYPVEHLPVGVTVVDNKVNRPKDLQYEQWADWCDKLVGMRLQLRITGSTE